MSDIDTDFSKFNTLCVDADWVLHAASNSGEKKTIKAILKSTGEEFDLANRTALFGRKKSKDGGYLEELNKSRDTNYTWEDFEILDVQTPEELPNVLHTVKMMIEGLTKTTGIKKKELYIGEGRSFRHARSTLLEYKGTRSTNLVPIHKEAVKEYMIKYHGAIVVRDLEVDDVVIIRGVESSRNLVVSVDKDSMGCAVSLYNPTHPEWGIMDCRGFGGLWWDTSGKQKKLRGIGRKFFYLQWILGDKIDLYSPTAACDIQFGEVGAYDLLNDCKTDLECFLAIKGFYQMLYPEPKKIRTWCGEVVEIDWLYVANEIFDLARMKRSYDDNVTASDVFRKYGLLDN